MANRFDRGPALDFSPIADAFGGLMKQQQNERLNALKQKELEIDNRRVGALETQTQTAKQEFELKKKETEIKLQKWEKVNSPMTPGVMAKANSMATALSNELGVPLDKNADRFFNYLNKEMQNGTSRINVYRQARHLWPTMNGPMLEAIKKEMDKAAEAGNDGRVDQLAVVYDGFADGSILNAVFPESAAMDQEYWMNIVKRKREEAETAKAGALSTQPGTKVITPDGKLIFENDNPPASSIKTQTDLSQFVQRANDESVRTTGQPLTPGEKNEAALQFKRAQADEVKANRWALRNVDAATAQTIARNKEAGKMLAQIELTPGLIKAKGEETPVEKMERGKQGVSGRLAAMAQAYLDLNSLGAIINLENSTTENLLAALSSSEIGQEWGRVTGNKAQSIRNSINAIKPLLIQDIRQSTNMSARGIDSEKELDFYLKGATNEKLDLQSNIAHLIVLDRAYGKGELAPVLEQYTSPDIVRSIAEQGRIILGGNKARQGGGNTLTPELAQDFMNQAKGNRELARKLAKEAGYNF